MKVRALCVRCGGSRFEPTFTGEDRDLPCSECQGQGYIEVEEQCMHCKLAPQTGRPCDVHAPAPSTPAKLNVIEGKFEPDPAIAEALRKVLTLAERGEIVSMAIACVHRDDSVSTAWAGGKRITLSGALRTLDLEMFCYGAGILDPSERKG